MTFLQKKLKFQKNKANLNSLKIISRVTRISIQAVNNPCSNYDKCSCFFYVRHFNFNIKKREMCSKENGKLNKISFVYIKNKSV